MGEQNILELEGPSSRNYSLAGDASKSRVVGVVCDIRHAGLGRQRMARSVVLSFWNLLHQYQPLVI